VQAPTEYELAINFETAKAPVLTVPPSLLAIANDVIERRLFCGARVSCCPEAEIALRLITCRERSRAVQPL
jgi:hypothetical protein